MENKFNWGNFVLGLIVGAVVVGVIWYATKPAASGAQANTCDIFQVRVQGSLEQAGDSGDVLDLVKQAMCELRP